MKKISIDKTEFKQKSRIIPIQSNGKITIEEIMLF